MCKAGRLHGSKAVAELKGGRAGAGPGRPRGSPRLKSRGRIEGPLAFDLFWGVAVRLHGSKAVAELKVSWSGPQGCATAASPRLKSRGRIEGAVVPNSVNWWRNAPDKGSPRLKSRGRIEGSKRYGVAVNPMMRLHGSKAVAELKGQYVQDQGQAVLKRLHGSKAVAELKAVDPCPLVGRDES